jgi:hypothetical protein
MNGLRMVYTDPPTFMGMLLECGEFIDRARQDAHCSKDDVLDSMETRLSLLVGKLASQPTSAAFAIHFPQTDAYS